MSEQNKSLDPQESQNKPKKKKRRVPLGKKMAIFFVYFLLIAGLIVGGGGLYVASVMIEDAPEISLSDFEGLESSQVYDKDGNLITELGAYLRENITYDDMPASLVDAFVAIEDSRFFEHPGFDVPRFAKAALENLKSKSFGQGGSTFTMQLVKNTYFQVDDLENSTIAEKSVDRKVQEIWTALKLEKLIDKKQIFQLYLNKLNFGGNIRGVQKAAQYYFGKNAKMCIRDRFYMMTKTFVDHRVVIGERLGIGLRIVQMRKNPSQCNREAENLKSHFRKQSDILFICMIKINSPAFRVVADRTGLPRFKGLFVNLGLTKITTLFRFNLLDDIRKGQCLSLYIPRAFRLTSSDRAAPQKIVAKSHVFLLSVFRNSINTLTVAAHERG